MKQDPLRRLIGTLNTVAGPTAQMLSDAQLLERFVTNRDEGAFELLMWRHGAMVLGVCTRMLGDRHDAEDAFQATFLVLARKAASVARGEAVGPWLARVACRAALRARSEKVAQARRERQAAEQPAAPQPDDAEQAELRLLLDEEIDRLPAGQRAAVVLCCLEGKTGEQAARELGCPPGTVSSRLTRARDRLRRRLARRGVAPDRYLPERLPEGPCISLLPAPLVARALEAALAFAARQGAAPALATTYAEGVLRAMFLDKLKRAVWVVLLAGVLGLGVFATHRAVSAGSAPREHAVGDEDSKLRAAGKPAPVAVRVVSPQTGGIPLTGRVAGTVQAYDKVDVLPAVSGTLKSLDVDVGDAVKRGQLLGVIDAPLLAIAEKEAAVSVRLAKGQVQLELAKAATAKAEVEVAKTVVNRRKADVDAAKALLAAEQTQLKRLQTLYETKVVDQRLVDEKAVAVEAGKAHLVGATAAVENALADLEVKRSKVVEGEVALAGAEAQVELAGLALERARLAASLTRLAAPFDGIVTERNVRAGHLLRGGEGSGRLPLLTIQRTDKVLVVAEVAENEAPLVKPGVEADVAIGSARDTPLKGRTITRVGFALDPKTRTMRVEIEVPNPKGQFRPGEFGSVTLYLEKATPGAVRLPISSIARYKGEPAVYLVRDGKARRTPVKLGHDGGGEVEVVSGLKPTDLIVADPKGFTEEVVPVETKEKHGGK